MSSSVYSPWLTTTRGTRKNLTLSTLDRFFPLLFPQLMTRQRPMMKTIYINITLTSSKNCKMCPKYCCHATQRCLRWNTNMADEVGYHDDIEILVKWVNTLYSWLNYRVRGQFEIKILLVRLRRNQLKTSNLSADNFKKYSTSMGRYPSPRYVQVALVSRYPVLTGVNWSQHGCAISGCTWAPKLLSSARKCEIKYWFPCGADGRSAVGVLSRDYQIF